MKIIKSITDNDIIKITSDKIIKKELNTDSIFNLISNISCETIYCSVSVATRLMEMSGFIPYPFPNNQTFQIGSIYNKSIFIDHNLTWNDYNLYNHNKMFIVNLKEYMEKIDFKDILKF